MQVVREEVYIHPSEKEQMNNMIKHSVQQIITINFVMQYMYICSMG